MLIIYNPPPYNAASKHMAFHVKNVFIILFNVIIENVFIDYMCFKKGTS